MIHNQTEMKMPVSNVMVEGTLTLPPGAKGSVVCAQQFDHELTTAQTVAALEKQKRLPKAILSDHGSQFKEQWKTWCSQH